MEDNTNLGGILIVPQPKVLCCIHDIKYTIKLYKSTDV